MLMKSHIKTDGSKAIPDRLRNGKSPHYYKTGGEKMKSTRISWMAMQPL
jgi:hypothetical protein